jgi:uridine kinase
MGVRRNSSFTLREVAGNPPEPPAPCPAASSPERCLGTKRSRILEELSARILALRREHPVRVAVDGVDASGKTVLADELAARISARGRPVIRASIDGFHHPDAVRHRRGDSPAGYFEDSFNYEALVRELLSPLGPGGSRWYRRAVFDYRTDRPVSSTEGKAQPDAVLLFDGVFLLRSALRPCWDFSIFVQADFPVTVARAEVRDQHLFGNAAAVRRRYEARYVPGQRLYLESERPQAHASVIIHNNDPANPSLETRSR